MKKIVLNCVPPFEIYRPSPALSILKSWLTKHEHDSLIIYWNIIMNNLQRDFVWNNPKVLDASNALALYVNYLVCNEGKKSLYNSFKNVISGFSPHYLNVETDYFDNHMKKYAEKMDEIIDFNISKVNINDTPFLWGFSMKMEGWIVSSIIAGKIKRIAPDIPILIGGINTKKTAKIFLENFPQFDLAIWGEGENPLVELVDIIKNGNSEYAKVGNIAYRKRGNVLFSEKKKRNFINLSENNLYPDYGDYFYQIEGMNLKIENKIPIEGSRGCHWNKCKFCYLNTDYKYRTKTISKICEEIKYLMNKHKVYTFEFLDNDFIGLDIERANKLIEELITIKKETPKFKITTVEVVTKGLDREIIKKMYEAGITFVQIGYENPSSNLLKKINKKNTFASNLLYVKFATLYNTPLYSVTLITNMPEETVDDIIEATDNLKYLRFFLHPIKFKHALIPVQVSSSSKYYSHIKDEKKEWMLFTIAHDFLKEYIDKKYHWDIFSFVKQNKHYQWNTFKRIEKYYLDNKHTYSITKGDGKSIKYNEYVNGIKINEFDIEEDSIEYIILYAANDKVISLKELTTYINNKFSGKYTEWQIKNVIDKYYHAGLIYCSTNYMEILSIVNIY
jgi:radical SAM superfamily enzyme YgiQ (UPF0313 family)